MAQASFHLYKPCNRHKLYFSYKFLFLSIAYNLSTARIYEQIMAGDWWCSIVPNIQDLIIFVAYAHDSFSCI